MPQAGAACGWVMAYVDILVSEYHMNLRTVFLDLPFEAGLALCEARAARLNPKRTIGYVDRCIMAAMARVRADFASRFTIVA